MSKSERAARLEAAVKANAELRKAWLSHKTDAYAAEYRRMAALLNGKHSDQ